MLIVFYLRTNFFPSNFFIRDGNRGVVAHKMNGAFEKYSVCEKSKSKISRWTVFKIISVFVFFLVFLVTSYASIKLYTTDVYERWVLEKMKVRNDTPVFEIWKKPEAYNLVHIYPFNYTNVDQALLGEEKLKVQETGPYVFREQTAKTNVVFESDDLVTFTENRTHVFIPELSKGNLSDVVIAPNVPVISAISKSLADSWLTQKAMKLILMSYRAQVFSPQLLEDFILGSDGDRFSVAVRQLSKLFKNEKPPRFGVLVQRTGLREDRLTVGTGVQNLDRIGVIHTFNGEDKLNVWSSDKCNNLTGSDGSLYPGRVVATTDTVHIYAKSLCRRIPLHFSKETTTPNGFPVRRFVLSKRVFSSGSENPDNDCFCQEDCPPSGTFSVKPCNFGAPIVLSYPHFLYGDTVLIEDIDGLNPIKEKHEFYMDIHSTLGLPLAGHSRFQIGIVVPEAPFDHQINLLKPGLVLPIAWVDIEIGQITGNIYDMLYEGTYGANYLGLVFRISAPLSALVSLLLVFAICHNLSR